MKKLFLLAALFLVSVSLFPQQVAEETFVINVEIPVRVFNGNIFVEDLTIDDFEVFEDGLLQKIEAVYLVKKRSIERREEKRRFSPETSRSFYLFFEVSEYTPKLGEAIEYFVDKVVAPGDTLIVITPMQTYRLRSKTFEVLSKDEIVNQLKKILRKDALVGSSEYRDTIDDITRLAKSLAGSVMQARTQQRATTDTAAAAEAAQVQTISLDRFTGAEYDTMPLDEQLTRYADLLDKLENIRTVEQDKFLEFARLLKDKEGQKYVFMFYEREFIPKVDPRILNEYMSIYQDRPDVIHNVTSLFDFYRREISLDVTRVKQAYADSSISIHFLFISKPAPHIAGVKMEERSEDIYGPLREMARATGGFFDSSANSASLFKKALESAENYYLLYYSPENYRRDGKFREIKVRVKGRDYKVSHRLGYLAS